MMTEKHLKNFSESTGIYIHIPFCLRKCFYCDFYSVIDTGLTERYVSALIESIRKKGKTSFGKKVDTVYFGGGTPSLMTVCEFESILNCVTDVFDVSKDAEITAEVNPATVDEKKLYGMRCAGINRLSIGMQSADDEELAVLGRLHRHIDTVNTFDDARKCGFDNISLDLMYALPEQTEEKWRRSYTEAASLSPEHISFYALTLSDECPLSKKNYFYPEDEVQLKMYSDAIAYLKDLEYNQYEISNLSKNGFHSRHNMKYWSLADYIGFGTSAHSFENGRRYFISDDISSFIEGKCDEITEEICTEDDLINEKIMLSLRTSDGLVFEELGRFCLDRGKLLRLKERLLKKIVPFTKSGHAVTDDFGIRLTEKGFFISNGIICELLP